MLLQKYNLIFLGVVIFFILFIICVLCYVSFSRYFIKSKTYSEVEIPLRKDIIISAEFVKGLQFYDISDDTELLDVMCEYDLVPYFEEIYASKQKKGSNIEYYEWMYLYESESKTYFEAKLFKKLKGFDIKKLVYCFSLNEMERGSNFFANVEMLTDLTDGIVSRVLENQCIYISCFSGRSLEAQRLSVSKFYDKEGNVRGFNITEGYLRYTFKEAKCEYRSSTYINK